MAVAPNTGCKVQEKKTFTFKTLNSHFEVPLFPKYHAPINVKPERKGGGGGGSVSPRKFACNVYLLDGDFDRTSLAFDLSISNSRREVNHLLMILLTVIFCLGVGRLIFF